MRIRWTKQAKDDLRAIHDYVSRDSRVNARRLVRRIRDSVNQLKLFPESGGMLVEFEQPALRQILESPYRIIYQIIENQVQILTIIHGARNWPGDITTNE